MLVQKKHYFFSHYCRSLNFCRCHSEGIEKTTPGCDLFVSVFSLKSQNQRRSAKEQQHLPLPAHVLTHSLGLMAVHLLLPATKTKRPHMHCLNSAACITNWKNNVCDERCIVTQQTVGKTQTLPNFDAPPEVMSCHINLEDVRAEWHFCLISYRITEVT